MDKKNNLKTENFTKKILVVDDEKNMRDSLSQYLDTEGYKTVCASSGNDAIKILTSTIFHAILLDLKMPGLDGLECIKIIRSKGDKTPILMMSAHGDIHDAVAAMKLGSNDYVVKPFDPQELIIRLTSIIEKQRLENLKTIEKRLSEQPVNKMKSPSRNNFVFESKNSEMLKIAQIIHKAAPTQTTILISGETGTGKEVLAKSIHKKSNRKEDPFVPINIGAMQENLLESELFGYEKGAFTGANERKIGLFELASGGTLFLDEIGEMPLQTQVKLLRVLQERTIMRLGGITQIPIDVRIVAATNSNLAQKINEGSFREDLYYRLNIIQISIPPLRDRKEDIIPLANFFLDKFASREDGLSYYLSEGAIEILKEYSYPGNIRELENLIERAVILSESNLIVKENLAIYSNKNKLFPEKDKKHFEENKLENIEKQTIIEVLQQNNWHRERSAKILGISRRTLLNKIQIYELKQDDY